MLFSRSETASSCLSTSFNHCQSISHFRVLALLALLATLLLSVNMAHADDFAGGDGSDAAPYQVEDWHQLNNVRNHLASHFVLNNSLSNETEGYDDHASTDANGGKGWLPIGNDANRFSGTFNGAQHTIGGLFIARPEVEEVGLFGRSNSASEIKNIGVTDVQVTGDARVGALVGHNNGHVNNSFSTGEVKGLSFNVGGLVGRNEGVTSQSYSSASVMLLDSPDSRFRSTFGGLVGINIFDGLVEDSYSTGDVIGHQDVGGLVGRNETTSAQVINSFSTGSVQGSSGRNVGGLIGRISDGVVNNSFWDTRTSGLAGEDDGVGNQSATGSGVTGKTTAELSRRNTFSDVGWSIEETTELYTGAPYPGLRLNETGSVWLIGAFAVTYDSNDATFGTAPEAQLQFSNDPATLVESAGDLERAFFVFSGWNTKANGEGVEYAAGQTFQGNENIILFAQWDEPEPVDDGTTVCNIGCTVTKTGEGNSRVVFEKTDADTGASILVESGPTGPQGEQVWHRLTRTPLDGSETVTESTSSAPDTTVSIEQDANGKLQVVSQVLLSNDNVVKVIARVDGSAEHRVITPSGETVVGTDLTGARTTISDEGEVRTSLKFSLVPPATGDSVEARTVAVTEPDGKGLTKVEQRDSAQGTWSHRSSTIDQALRFEIGHIVRIENDSATGVSFRVETPVSSALSF